MLAFVLGTYIWTLDHSSFFPPPGLFLFEILLLTFSLMFYSIDASFALFVVFSIAINAVDYIMNV